MHGKLWYLGLVVLSIAVIAISYWKSKNKLVFAFLFGMAGISYMIDFVIYFCLKSYVYQPGFVQDKQTDSLIGESISDVLSLPSASILIAVFKLNWGWIIAISGMFVGVETLFLKLGIYELHWWKTYYTFICLLFYFAFAKGWFRRINLPHGLTLSFVTLLAIEYFVKAQFSIILYGYLKSGYFTVRWIDALGFPSWSINAPISLFVAIVLTSLIVFRIRLLWKVAAIAGLFVMDLGLSVLHMMHTRTYWHFVYLILANVLLLLIGQAFARLIWKNQVPSSLHHQQPRS